MTKDKRTGRRRRGAALYTPFAVLLIAVITIFGVSVFFRVTDIEITGARTYPEEQIASASGIKEGDNLIFIDGKAVARIIRQKLPYLSEVAVEKSIPNRLVIRVAESNPLAAVRWNGDWYVVDQKARVLDKTDEAGTAGRIVVTGLTPESASQSAVLAVSEEDRTKLLYLTNVLTALENAGMAGDVSALDVSGIANISFKYGRFTVLLGSGENTAYRLTRLAGIIAGLESDEKGRIDVSDDGQPASFIPEYP